MSFPFWRLEWRIAFRRRRLLALNVAIPPLLVLPIAIADAPPHHAAAVYAVLFVLFGTFGSAIPLLREGDGGPLRRIVLAGACERRLLAERVLAGAAVDFLQLLPAFALVFATGRPDPFAMALAVPALAVGLLVANLVGAWVAAAARSIAEGALFAAIVSLFLLHGSGVFRTAAPGTWAATLQTVLPFGPLHSALLRGAGGEAPPLTAQLAIPTVLALAAFFATHATAPLLLERITAER